MPRVYFVTHPEVAVDPAVAVPDWPLSERGRQRATVLLTRRWIRQVGAVFSSTERKAAEVAAMLAGALGVAPVAFAELGENDRAATGYLPPVEFEAMADAFFARPYESVRGWERAIDAQVRIVGAVDRALGLVRADGDVAIVSHGGVGALLLGHLKQVPISRTEDQPGRGGGNVFCFDAATRRLIAGWRSIEDS
ncbi:MAG TPA: histidine phosphatase family protein [Acetobacteraceae bacterium]|nr:histidine phosphatase family protein [Acetobacteraceae bacterium]